MADAPVDHGKDRLIHLPDAPTSLQSAVPCGHIVDEALRAVDDDWGKRERGRGDRRRQSKAPLPAEKKVGDEDDRHDFQGSREAEPGSTGEVPASSVQIEGENCQCEQDDLDLQMLEVTQNETRTDHQWEKYFGRQHGQLSGRHPPGDFPLVDEAREHPQHAPEQQVVQREPSDASEIGRRSAEQREWNAKHAEERRPRVHPPPRLVVDVPACKGEIADDEIATEISSADPGTVAADVRPPDPDEAGHQQSEEKSPGNEASEARRRVGR